MPSIAAAIDLRGKCDERLQPLNAVSAIEIGEAGRPMPTKPLTREAWRLLLQVEGGSGQHAQMCRATLVWVTTSGAVSNPTTCCVGVHQWIELADGWAAIASITIGNLGQDANVAFECHRTMVQRRVWHYTRTVYLVN